MLPLVLSRLQRLAVPLLLSAAILDISACNSSGGSSVPSVSPTASPTPQATLTPSSSSVTTSSLTSASPATLPTVGSYTGTVTYTAASGQPFTVGTTVQLQTFIGAPTGSPAAQARARHILSLTPQAVFSIEATFSNAVTIGDGSNVEVLLPNATASNYTAETYDLNDGSLVASVAGSSSSGGTYTFTSSGTSYLVVPTHIYLTMIVANSQLGIATASPLPSASATSSAAPSASSSPTAVPTAAPTAIANVQFSENASQGQLSGIALSSSGVPYVIDEANNSIDIFNNSFSRVAVSGTPAFTGVFSPSGFAWPAFGPTGDLWFPHSVLNSVGRMSLSDNSITDYPLPTSSSGPSAVVKGPDQAMWVSESSVGKIARIDSSGTVTEMAIPSGPSSDPTQIVVGPDNALWFIEAGSGKLGRIATSATPSNPQITEVTLAYPGCVQFSLTSGPLNSLWYLGCSGSTSTLVAVTTGGVATSYSFPTGFTADARFVTTGNDGALWLTDQNSNYIGHMVPQGSGVGTFTKFPYTLVGGNGTGNAGAGEIVPGSGNTLWWVEYNTGNLGKLTY